MEPKLIYSEIPENYQFCKLNENRNEYAWISLVRDNDNMPKPRIETWIFANWEILAIVNFQVLWFKNEIKDLLGDRFVLNSNLEYLIEFIWEKGDWSVGISDGYNCSLVYDSKGEPVTRSWKYE